MIDFTIETEIARPPADVFAYVTDPSKLPTWQTNTVSAIPDGEPITVGTRIHEVHRGPGGRKLTSLVEVAELVPDHVFALRILEGSLPLDARIELEASAAGTTLRFRVHGQPRGPMRLAQPLLRRVVRRQFAEHCATLRRVLEDRPPPDGGRDSSVPPPSAP